MRATDIPKIDMFGADDERKALKATSVGIVNGRNAVNANSYVQAVAMERLVRGGASQTELVTEHGINQSQLSKALKVVNAARYVVAPMDFVDVSASKQDAVVTAAANLETYWKHCHDGDPEAVRLFEEWCRKLTGDDGVERVGALRDALTVFGAPSSAYAVAAGSKFHPLDPRNDESTDQDGEQSEGEQDESDDEKVSWQTRLAAIVTQARLEGASVSDILTVVNAACK